MTQLLLQLVEPTPIPPVKLELRPGDPQSLIDLLKRGVNQYSDPRVTLSLERVRLGHAAKKVRLIVRRIRSFKFRQIEAFIKLHEQFNIPFGTPADIFANDQYVSSITPPVLEEWGDDLVAIEGNTRIFRFSQSGKDHINAIVVRQVTHPLPGKSLDPGRALISTYEVPYEERIEGFDYGSFRSIEGAARPEE
jgi:hypothetical protein